MEGSVKKITLVAAAVLVFSGLGLPGHSTAGEGVAAPPQLAGQPDTAADKIIVAKVNGTGITMASLITMMNRIGPQKVSDSGVAGTDSEVKAAVRKEALDRLIMFELAYQKAKEQGLNPTRAAIDAAIDKFKGAAGGEKEYRNFLVREGITGDVFRDQVGRNLALQYIFAQEVYNKITIPQDTLKEEYEREKSRFLKPESMLVVDVVVSAKSGKADKESGVIKAGELLEKLRQDKDNDPWKLTLDGTFNVRNYQIRKDKDKELYDAVLKLKPGEVSEVVTAEDGFHIIKLKKYSPERYYTLEEARGTIERKFRVEAQQKRLREWEQELKKNAVIELLDVQDKGPKAEK